MYHDLEDAIREVFGRNTAIRTKYAVSGGDINEAYQVSLTDGQDVFLKVNSRAKKDFFAAEAEGLKAMKAAGAAVPEVLAFGETVQDGAFLLLEYVSRSAPSKTYWSSLGHMLGEMHRASAGQFAKRKKFGFLRDNFIGMTKQVNLPQDSWISFFRTNRLVVQMKMADRYFDQKDRTLCRHLLDHLDEYLTEPQFPSLLHGDLWGGNVMTDSKGGPMLIDPAVYVGHHEADLAMTELFGGFSGVFYDAYHEAVPKEPGYIERRELYNLYHLLNHLNLFGGSYLSSVRRILQRYGE